MSSKKLATCLLALLCWTAPAFANPKEKQIEALQARVDELSVQIRNANIERDRAKAAQLREWREIVQQELRTLKRELNEEKRQQQEAAKRTAVEREWAALPPQKQLCAAIQYQRLDLVRKVVESGAVDLQKTNDHCLFPLAEAAAQGQLDIAEYLLQQKSPLVMRAPNLAAPVSALDAAAASRQDRTQMLDLLKKYGASPVSAVEVPLPPAIAGSGDAGSQKLLQEKFNLDKSQLSAGSSLLRALEEGHVNNIRWLLKAGADPNEATLGRTALMVAVDSNDLEKVSALVQAGADVNQPGLNYVSLLTYAEKRQARVTGRRKAEMDEIIRYLKSQGAQKSAQELNSALGQ